MASTWSLSKGLAAVVVTSAAALALSPSAAADPATPPPSPIQQLPGLPALDQLSPIIQQAATNPGQATQMLMAAAQAFTQRNPTAPAEAQNVAKSVGEFVAEPSGPNGVVPTEGVPHVPPAGVQPGTLPHLPTGIDPNHAAGPPPAAPPAPEPHLSSQRPVDPVRAEVPARQPGAATPAPPPDAPAPAPAATPASAPTPAPAQAASPPPGFGPDTPVTQDFMYPSIGTNCIADGTNAFATALSVAGPAPIPAPGPGPGQTAYVFTAVGTPGPAEVQKLPLNVTWINLTTGKSGSVTLKPRPDINPDGPTTLTAIADTGSGSIMSTIFGQVTTKERQCQFMPTIGSTVVP
ncbi:Rv1157c family protein [Mycobacterium bourgelatii]|uniref:Uncharacterized protein n=1 Tax=Mycobacterium bourgelatii TaxID=1273442 RepID=A0A7I9YUG1_MYCBU|nr:hypothetical protein [Mycobacterium bourgelatii]MCV6974899.1 hypothetical protein [Mycobacterium bourgelatii]GFG92285.1 hypothetical protein MBOU_43270 [Mycobacterium bourgelatii]